MIVGMVSEGGGLAVASDRIIQFSLAIERCA